ncbi:Myb/SANT-like DNA-binding domain-containing protein [Carex littledalei]|uniref:Myb/SANT-like DNA-binding domain-containing protein n=1 Tax=Carex littledalei TaxID=544730 RepID=A0A833QJX6_9POAL|nr:Myb/SANT-like DNA-binding domain-containing protein [Carex littledalei]
MDLSGSRLKRQPVKNKKKGGGEAAQRIRAQNWSVDQTTLMLNLIRKEQVAQRVGGHGTFTKQFWNKLAPNLNSQSEPYRQSSELQRRWKTLKADFYDYKNCVNKTGWRWDRDKHVPIAPDESKWEELRKHNAKLYKCKSKAFVWYDLMNELCGSNVLSRNYATSVNLSEQLEDHASKSDSSDNNHNAERELNEIDIGALRTTKDVDSNYSIGKSFCGEPIEHSPEVASGATLGGSSSKRVREGSVGAGCGESSQGKKSKGEPNSENKNSQYDAAINLIAEELRQRRVLLEEVKNKGKKIAEKLLKVKRELKMSRQDFSILQEVLHSELSKDLFMIMEGVELNEWIEGGTSVIPVRSLTDCGYWFSLLVTDSSS